MYARKKQKSNNKSKQRPSPPNNPIFKILLYKYLQNFELGFTYCECICRVKFTKIQLNKLALTSLSSLLIFSVSLFLSV